MPQCTVLSRCKCLPKLGSLMGCAVENEEPPIIAVPCPSPDCLVHSAKHLLSPLSIRTFTLTLALSHVSVTLLCVPQA